MDELDMTYSNIYLEECDIAKCATDLTAAKEQLKQLIIKLEHSEVVDGTEGLWDITKSILTAIGNVTLHIANLTKTYIFKFYKSVKRTEIVYYNESNRVSMSRIWACNMEEVGDLVMPYPNGMKTSYLDALDKNYTALESLDIATRANIGVTLSANILAALKSRSVVTDIIASGIVSASTDNIKIPVDLAIATITDENTSNKLKKFKELFTSVAELEKCNDKAMSFTDFVDQTNMAHKKIEKISDNFNEIVKLVERTAGNGIAKADIEALSKLAYMLGDTFDTFAKCLFNFHKLEHNLVECYKEIRRKLGL